MIYTSKVITRYQLQRLLTWNALRGYGIGRDCAYMGTDYDFSKFSFIDDETIISKVEHYIHDMTAEWVSPNATFSHGDELTLAKIVVCTEGLTKEDDVVDAFFYMDTKDYNALTDISHQSILGENDIFNCFLEFWKAHGHEYNNNTIGCIEDFKLPLDIFHKHIKKHKEAKFRIPMWDIDHMLLWLSDRWEMYLPEFEKHRYTSTAGEAQEYMFNKFFTTTKNTIETD